MREKSPTPNQAKSSKVRDRINIIADLMASGLYETHVTAVRLGAEWGISPRTVENYACRASHKLREAVGDDQQIRDTMVNTLNAIREVAFKRANSGHEKHGFQWMNTAINSIVGLSKLLGIEAPAKTVIKHEVELDEVDALKKSMMENACSTTEPAPNYSRSPSPILEPSAASSTFSQKTPSDAS